MTGSSAGVGVVVIGRNEGDRLRRCLRSVSGAAEAVVYVDSGSTDGSVEFARSLGVHVVDLDLSSPFTMPRGRNAGFEALVEVDAEVSYVQFVDGDCEVVPGWLQRARSELDAHPDVAVVCGRRRERHPEASRYNRLCDIEWGGATGEVDACGGDAMMRVEAFQEAGGFLPSMIAGEEAELCLRLRQLGWKVLRVDAPMTLHDANIMHFGQCWKRWVRCGHAYAEGWFLHRGGPERHNVRPVASTVFWGGLVPTATLTCLALALWHPWSLVVAGILTAGYGVLWLRAYRYCTGHGAGRSDAAWYALSCIPAKLAQLVGVATFFKNRARGRRTGLIEYKEA